MATPTELQKIIRKLQAQIATLTLENERLKLQIEAASDAAR